MYELDSFLYINKLDENKDFTFSGLFLLLIGKILYFHHYTNINVKVKNATDVINVRVLLSNKREGVIYNVQIYKN